MRTLLCLLLLSVIPAGGSPCQAQQLPAAVPDSVAAMPPAPRALGTFDVIVRTNGDELPVQVLRISPLVVRYLPQPVATSLPGMATTDTLELAASEVVMIRYADGTRQVLQPAPPAGAAATIPSLADLSEAQRYERGRHDSRQYYKPAPGVFWGTLAGSLGASIGLVGVGTGIALATPPRANLNAPAPALLNDPAYYKGYVNQANKRKLGKVAIAFVLGVPVAVGVGMLIFSSGLLGTIK